jgi:hypothetical protein
VCDVNFFISESDITVCGKGIHVLLGALLQILLFHNVILLIVIYSYLFRI